MDVLVDMIKSQLGSERRDDDTQRDVFLCLAVSIPPTQQVVFRKALGPLLARARVRSLRNQDVVEDLAVPAQLERRIGAASTLLVLGCPDVCDIDIGTRLMAVNTWASRSAIWPEKVLLKRKAISLQLAFAMVLGLLHPSEWASLPPTTAEYQDLARQIRVDFRGAELTSCSQSFWLSWEGLQTRSLQLAGLIAYVLRVGGFEDVPRSDLLPFLRPPAPLTTSQLKIPLLENFGEDGIRPQATSWQEWYAARVRDLVESIEEEEWYGYYVYTLENTDNLNPLGSRDPAMESIFFKLGGGGGGATTTTRRNPQSAPMPPACNNNPPPPARRALEAQGGKDGVTGEFGFFGHVATNTGHVSLRKTYKGAHYWDYDGVMTPVGIVGEWGREGTGYNGYFWLWKRSWMAGDAVQKTTTTYAYS